MLGSADRFKGGGGGTRAIRKKACVDVDVDGAVCLSQYNHIIEAVSNGLGGPSQ